MTTRWRRFSTSWDPSPRRRRCLRSPSPIPPVRRPSRRHATLPTSACPSTTAASDADQRRWPSRARRARTHHRLGTARRSPSPRDRLRRRFDGAVDDHRRPPPESGPHRPLVVGVRAHLCAAPSRSRPWRRRPRRSRRLRGRPRRPRRRRDDDPADPPDVLRRRPRTTRAPIRPSPDSTGASWWPTSADSPDPTHRRPSTTPRVVGPPSSPPRR